MFQSHSARFFFNDRKLETKTFFFCFNRMTRDIRGEGAWTSYKIKVRYTTFNFNLEREVTQRKHSYDFFLKSVTLLNILLYFVVFGIILLSFL